MIQNNFSRLIDEISKQQAETFHCDSQKTLSKSLPTSRKKKPTLKANLNSLCKLSKAIGRGLDKIKYPTLSKGERRILNRQKMHTFRDEIRQGILNKSLTANQVALLETKANHLSNALASKGLI